MTESQPIELPDPPEVSLMQYLYVGKEHANYQPGNWFVHKYYEKVNVSSIEEIAKSDRPLAAVECIMKAYESKMVQNPETLVFALAVCARQKENRTLRHAAYEAMKTVCSTPQHFILFVKFASELAKKETEPKHGWGRGWRTAVNNWYLSKDTLELLEVVTKYKGRYGWSHKDIIKLSHPKTDDVAKKAVFAYIMHGLKEASNSFANEPEAEEVFGYIKSVEEVRHCEDEIQAARLLEINHFALEHVPGHLLKSEEVWNALIPSMSLTMLLNNLQRIHNMGFLKPYATAVDKIVDALGNLRRVSVEQIHPALILITVRNYEKSGKPLSFEKQKIRNDAAKPVPQPTKPNRKIVETLYKMLNASFANVEATDLRYMITVDMSTSMQENGAWQCGNVTAAEAGCLLALCLAKREKNVTVATFKNFGIHVVNLDKGGSLGQAVGRMKQAPIGNVNLEESIVWAMHKKKQFDVFINVVETSEMRVNNTSRSNGSALKTMKEYRSAMGLPNAKLITCVMTATRAPMSVDANKNNLSICGFDANVPKIIEAFARNYF